MITMPANNPSLLISPTIQYATLTINFNVTIQKWCSTCHYILANLSGVASSLTSLLQVLQYVTLSHYFFRYSKNQPPTYEESIKIQRKPHGQKISQRPSKEMPCSNQRGTSPSITPYSSSMKVIS